MFLHSVVQFYIEYQRIQHTLGRNKTTIDLRGLNLSFIPSEAEHLIHLRDINFSYNSLTSVPQFLSILPNLTILNLEGNYISSLFEDKMMLPDTIVVLNVNYNRIRQFPSAMKKLISKSFFLSSLYAFFFLLLLCIFKKLYKLFIIFF